MRQAIFPMRPATFSTFSLSLHDALPIFEEGFQVRIRLPADGVAAAAEVQHRRRRDAHLWRARRHGLEQGEVGDLDRDRKSTRLNSSHSQISYAVFCLKKKIRRFINVTEV